MGRSFYLTHPEVTIDPEMHATFWSLSRIGRQRIENAASRGTFASITQIICSKEKKAQQAAAIISKHIGIGVIEEPLCNENERLATGFLTKEEFENTLNLLYERPNECANGWESASDTLNRMIAALNSHLVNDMNDNTLFVGHGTIGTLLKCHIGNRSIARTEDQRLMAAKGGGNMFAFEWSTQKLLTDWIALEDWPQH